MIFITGANGLVGSFIVRKLLSNNYRVKALKRENSDLSLLEGVSDKIEWVNGDICDIKLIDQSLEGIETVIHTAAIVSFAPQLKNLMFQVNVEGTANVVNSALKSKVKKFIHISSVAALGRKKNQQVIQESSFWEDSSYNSNYAKSKYLAELEVWRGMEEGLDGFILNPSVILGPGNWDSGSTKIFKYIWKENPFYSGGSMNFIDVRDVSNILLRLMEENKGNKERFILNSLSMSYKDLFYSIADTMNKKRPGYKAGLFLSEIAWRMEAAKAFITGGSPLLTKETVKLSKNSYFYDNSKISKLLNYEFIAPQQTIDWTCRELLNKYSV
jgi:dihydroflavonol-4-reductase